MSEVSGNVRLAAYQAAVLELLHHGTDGDAMVVELHDAAAALDVDLGPLDVVLIEVAADLTRFWGRRR